MDKIQFHAQRIRTILDRLSCFSRKIDSEYNIQVNWVLREFLSFYEKEAQDRDITFNLQFDEHLPTIRTDGSQVQQLLLKLIENALDAGARARLDALFARTGLTPLLACRPARRVERDNNLEVWGDTQ